MEETNMGTIDGVDSKTYIRHRRFRGETFNRALPFDPGHSFDPANPNPQGLDWSPVSIEYRVPVTQTGNRAAPHEDRVLSTDTAQCQWDINGAVWLLPLHETVLARHKSEGGSFKDFYWINVECYGGVNAEDRRVRPACYGGPPEIPLRYQELNEICAEHFPRMGISGELSFDTNPRQPIPKNAVADIVKKVLVESPEWIALSRAHHAFLKAYGNEKMTE